MSKATRILSHLTVGDKIKYKKSPEGRTKEGTIVRISKNRKGIEIVGDGEGYVDTIPISLLSTIDQIKILMEGTEEDVKNYTDAKVSERLSREGKSDSFDPNDGSEE